MERKEKAVILHPFEVREKIDGHENEFRTITIDNTLFLCKKFIRGGLWLTDITIKGNLEFAGVIIDGPLRVSGTIEGDLIIRNTRIEGYLDLKRAIIKGELRITEETTIKGYLSLLEMTIGKGLCIVTDEGPTFIHVDKAMAEKVHLAAPTISLIVNE